MGKKDGKGTPPQTEHLAHMEAAGKEPYFQDLLDTLHREMLLEKAQELHGAGFSVIPVRAPDHPTRKKSPTLPTLQDAEGREPGATDYQGARDTDTPKKIEKAFSHSEAGGIAIQCGACSGNLEVIDVDTKYDKGGTLLGEFLDLMQEHLSEVFPRLPIVRTPSGGAHIYYRAEKPAGEKANPALSWDETGKNATIETRTQGGYIITPPTEGYRFEQGSLDDIPHLSAEERQKLHTLARSFDLSPPKEAPAERRGSVSAGVTPGTDYNERGDVLSLLRAHGWKVSDSGGVRVNLTRPGGTNATSGNYHRAKNTVFIFSGSTELPPEQGLSPFAVYTYLEHGGDFTAAAQSLRAQGYGETSSGGFQTVTAKTDGLRVEFTDRQGETHLHPEGEPLTPEKVETIKPKSSRVYLTESSASDAVDVVRILCRFETSTPTVRVAVLEDLTDTPRETISGAEFLYDVIRTKYAETAEKQGGGLTSEQRDAMLSEFVEMGQTFHRSPITTDLFIRCFKEDEPLHKTFGVSPDSWEETIGRLQREQIRQEQEETLDLTVSRVSALRGEGKHSQAVEALSAGLEKLRSQDADREPLRVVTFADALEELATTPPGLPTGYKSLDSFARLPSGALTYVAARTSHGKTALLLNLLLNVAQSDAEGCAYFYSYEMHPKDLWKRLVMILHGRDFETRRADGNGAEKNYSAITRHLANPKTPEARDFLEEIAPTLKLINELQDTKRLALVRPATTYVEEAERHSLRLAKDGGVSAVFVDYVQCIGTERKSQDFRTRVSTVSGVFRSVSVETGLPFVVAAQVRRDAAGRIPTLEDLKESGSLEEDANTVLGLHNEHATSGEGGSEAQPLRIETLKNRDGERGRVTTLTLHGGTQKITESSSFTGKNF
jgi:replicative DNA helicase